LKKFLIKTIPTKYHNKISNLYHFFKGFYSKSYSQFCEDMILKNIFNKKKGFFIDIGAHHPFRLSNTYFFYKKGWSGINIDPLPGCMKLFNRFRKRDINLELGISKENSILNYFAFEEPAFNTFSDESAKKYIETNATKLIYQKKIECFPLRNILDSHLKENQTIDFLSIDAEGLDLEILESNDWNIYQPKVILIEIHDFNFDYISENLIYQFLKEKKYSLYASTGITFFFIRN